MAGGEGAGAAIEEAGVNAALPQGRLETPAIAVDDTDKRGGSTDDVDVLVVQEVDGDDEVDDAPTPWDESASSPTEEEVGAAHRVSSGIVINIMRNSTDETKARLGLAFKEVCLAESEAEAAAAAPAAGGADDEDGEVPDREATAEEIRCGLSNLGRATTGGIAFASFALESLGLTSVGFLQKFPLLENVRLAKNNLTSIEAIGALDSLFDLNVRGNRLGTCPGFCGPPNLRVADFGENRITEIEGFGEGSPLRRLNLDENRLTQISGLSMCRLLTELSLAGNQLTTTGGLEGLTSLKVLELQRNELETLDLTSLTALERLDVSDNRLVSLSGLKALPSLFLLNAARNRLTSFDDVRFIFKISSLVHLDFRGNPINETVEYRTGLIFRMKHVVTIDGQTVDPLDKVGAVNLFDPPPQTVAAVDHAMQTSSAVKKKAVVHAFHLASADDVYPMLVLVGPATAGKRELQHALCADADHFALCRSYTTRQIAEDADVGGAFARYHHVSFKHFEAMVGQGEFVQTCRINNEMYGLTRAELEGVVQSGRIPVLLMELEGAFILKKAVVGPVYVFTQPNMSAILGNSGSFRGLGLASVPAARLAQYLNAEREGFFDATVELGKHTAMEQLAPVREALERRLAALTKQIRRHHPQWIEDVPTA